MSLGRYSLRTYRIFSALQLRTKICSSTGLLSRNNFCGQEFFPRHLQKAYFSASASETPEKKISTAASHFREGSVRHPLDKDNGDVDINKEDFKPTKTAYTLPHPIWSDEEVNNIQITHRRPQGFVDWAAYGCVQTMRLCFDLISFYKIGVMDESKWLTRIILLESVAGVPGMVGAMTRHFHSLRRLARDHGWIHTLLEEAENERMHLLTAMQLKQPGVIFRTSVLLLQGAFVNMFFLAYLISPRFCHRFVGYLEEEAVKTYSYCIECIDNGKLPMWHSLKAPKIAVDYWKLQEDAMMRDVILAIRADEAHHRTVNHTFGSMKGHEDNPYGPGE